MTDKPRNWQEDMNGCTGLPPTPWAWVETDIGEWIEDSNQEIVIGSEDEYIFDDLLGGNVRKEAFMRFMINAPEALPYWLQQYAALEREYERFQKAATGWNDDLTKAEAVIEQKDAEIAAIKSMLLDAIGCLTMFGNEECEEQARRIARDLRKLTHVQPEHASGNTP